MMDLGNKVDCLSYNCGYLLSTNYGEKYLCSTNEERVPAEDAEDICGAGYHSRSVSALWDLISLFRSTTHLDGKAACGCIPWEL